MREGIAYFSSKGGLTVSVASRDTRENRLGTALDMMAMQNLDRGMRKFTAFFGSGNQPQRRGCVHRDAQQDFGGHAKVGRWILSEMCGGGKVVLPIRLAAGGVGKDN